MAMHIVEETTAGTMTPETGAAGTLRKIERLLASLVGWPASAGDSRVPPQAWISAARGREAKTKKNAALRTGAV